MIKSVGTDQRSVEDAARLLPESVRYISSLRLGYDAAMSSGTIPGGDEQSMDLAETGCFFYFDARRQLIDHDEFPLHSGDIRWRAGDRNGVDAPLNVMDAAFEISNQGGVIYVGLVVKQTGI